MNLQNLLDRRVDIVFARRLAVEDFDGERSARDSETRGFAVKVGKLKEICLTWHSYL